ncbi:MAG: hypothetical protein E6H98_07190 [Chloroflexi bacterium]|nr:MAG: hypothetical protein E6H98_07190 [Chloroflexota bacterium]
MLGLRLEMCRSIHQSGNLDQQVEDRRAVERLNRAAREVGGEHTGEAQHQHLAELHEHGEHVQSQPGLGIVFGFGKDHANGGQWSDRQQDREQSEANHVRKSDDDQHDHDGEPDSDLEQRHSETLRHRVHPGQASRAAR